ncbi:hypothetical protein [Streptomyces sp. NPDC002187]|uniref:hypothetical protein n=1 Tax=Streptomyces sp. NPDC002187 TaxID=3364637 RepID=UPI0036A52C4B
MKTSPGPGGPATARTWTARAVAGRRSEEAVSTLAAGSAEEAVTAPAAGSAEEAVSTLAAGSAEEAVSAPATLTAEEAVSTLAAGAAEEAVSTLAAGAAEEAVTAPAAGSAEEAVTAPATLTGLDAGSMVGEAHHRRSGLRGRHRGSRKDDASTDHGGRSENRREAKTPAIRAAIVVGVNITGHGSFSSIQGILERSYELGAANRFPSG